ncbi:hypothetical protein BH23CHL2_BH23CHL2_05930 [soil metagenome]
MRHYRTTYESVVDEALTLSVLAELEDKSSKEIDRLRLQKIIFLIAYRWFEKRWKGFNYPFFRYHWGPFTKDLYQTEMDLSVAGLIDGGRNWTLSLTPAGESLAAEMIERVWCAEDNAHFWQDIQQVIGEFGDLTTSQLLRSLYDMEFMPLGWREAWEMRDIPIGTDLIRVLEDAEADEIIEVLDEWIDTFGLTISRGARESQDHLLYEPV